MKTDSLAESVTRTPRRFSAVAACAALLAAVGATDLYAAAGDSWAYRVINGYSNEVRAKVQYRVDKADAERVALSFTTSEPALLGGPREEIYTPEGNWLKHALINHDQPVEYQFTQPYPAYLFPLDASKSWSVRVDAVNRATGRRVSVRVDGEVLGTERVTVPAGAFDTIKVRRRTYAGDFDGPRGETNITEIEWYAPALGRAVRIDSNSNYMDQDKCSDEMAACTARRGDWHIFELIDAGGAAR